MQTVVHTQSLAWLRKALVAILACGPLLAHGQPVFTLLADQPSFGIEPETFPFLAGPDVAFTGRLPVNIYKAGPIGQPTILLANGTPVPNSNPPDTFSNVTLLDWNGQSLAFLGSDSGFVERTYFVNSQGITQIAGAGSAVPQASGSALVHGDNVAWLSGNAVYAIVNDQQVTVVNNGTPVPGGAVGETFRFIFSFHFNGQVVAVNADTSIGTRGIYLFDLANNNAAKLVDSNDTAPGGQAPSNYDAFDNLAMGGNDVVFFAEMLDEREGLFMSTNFASPVVVSEKDLGSGTTLDPTAPNDFGRVDRIFAISVDGGEIAVVARDENRVLAGLYRTENGVFKRLLATGDDLQGRTVDVIHGSTRMLQGDALAIGVLFNGDVRAVFRIDNGQSPVTSSGMIVNGTFATGLTNWTPTGQVVTVPGPAVRLTSDTDPGVGTAQISQVIDTYNGTFMIFFDYRFTTTTGSLDVLINGTLIDSITAPPSLVPVMQQAQVVMNDPALMGLSNATLTIRLNPGSLSEAEIADVYSPQFRVGTLGLTHGVLPSIQQFDSPGQENGGNEVGVIDPVPTTPNYFEQDFGALALVSKSFDDGFDRGNAIARSLNNALGLHWGFRAFSESNAKALEVKAGLDGDLATTYTVVGASGARASVGFDLRMDGTIRIQGDFSQSEDLTRGSFTIVPEFLSERYHFSTPATSLIARATDRVLSDLYISEGLSNVTSLIPNLAPITITDNTGNPVAPELVVSLNAAVLSSNTVAEVPVGDLIEYRILVEADFGPSRATARAQPDFNGFVDTDFLNSFQSRLVISGGEARLVPFGIDPDFEINAGHAGAYYNQDTSGQGQLIDIDEENRFLFMAWFTHTDRDADDAFEQHWYTAQGNYTGPQAELAVYESTGGAFDADDAVTTEQVGTASIVFGDCQEGQMLYQFDDGRQGMFPLRRVIPDSSGTCEDLAGAGAHPHTVDINAGMDGAFYDPATSGQGWLLDVEPDGQGGGFMFVAWFTYGEDTTSGQHWYTAQGNYQGSKADLIVYNTTGGAFDDPEPVSTVAAGSMSIDFTDCDNAVLSYDLDSGPAGNVDATRILAALLQRSGGLCDALLEAP